MEAGFIHPSWSLHIQSICCKSRKLIGLLRRHFYPHSTPSVLFRLYNSLVRPHLEYCSCLWDPSSSASISSLEKVQFFALKLCSKNWSSSYSSLLHQIIINCPPLSLRRRNAKLIFLYKFLMVMSSFLLIFSLPNLLPIAMSTRSFHPNNLLVSFARTSAFRHSFVPSSSSLWNSLPASLKTCLSLSSFIYHLRNHL